MNDIDFLILKYISKFDSVHIDDILNKFPDNKFSTRYRLELLSEMEKHSSGHFYLENTSYIKLNYINCEDGFGGTVSKSTNTYSITQKGKVALQEYKLSQNKISKDKRKDFILKVLPIIISTLALLKSFDKEIISLWTRLMQLWKWLKAGILLFFSFSKFTSKFLTK